MSRRVHRHRAPRRNQVNRRSVLAGAAATGVLGSAYFFSGRRESAEAGERPILEEPTDLDVGFPDHTPYETPDGPVDVPPPRREFYSPESETLGQTFGDLYLPATANPSLPVIVLIHGGGWNDAVDLEYVSNMARDLASFDIAVWSIEYRRVGSGGGWPTTVADVCNAVDHLKTVNMQMGGRLDLTKVAVMGHSSGGHLALWVASRDALPSNLPGSKPDIGVTGCVSLAGISDMFSAAGRAGSTSVGDFLAAGPSENPERYHAASPISHLPTGVQVVAIHGDNDPVVPVRQSEDYVRRARDAGDDARLVPVPGANHDPWSSITSPAWHDARRIVLEMVGRRPFDDPDSDPAAGGADATATPSSTPPPTSSAPTSTQPTSSPPG